MKIEPFGTSKIVYLENKNIDKARWDECIKHATNGLVYARSFYLDAMAKNWDGLVMNDYEMVMPLTWNKKYGIYYLYQPFLCASCGIFGNNITGDILSVFLDNIPRRFKYWDIYLNAANNFQVDKYNFTKRTNYILDLNKPYPELTKKYRNSYKNLLKKSGENNLQVKRNINLSDIIRLAKIKMDPVSKIKKNDWQNFVQLYNRMSSTSEAVNYGVFSGNELLASGVFFFSGRRAYYVLAGNKDTGRSLGASHLIIDSFIKDYSAQEIILDFEGSNVAGIAFFFKGFGGKIEEYPGIKYNALPGALRRLKK